MCKQLQNYLDNNHLLSKFQFGFRKNHPNEFSVTYFTDNVLKGMDKGNLTCASFIDMKKAFDTPLHTSLLQKLERYGIMDTPLAWFSDYLSDRNQIVCVDGICSDPQPVQSGVFSISTVFLVKKKGNNRSEFQRKGIPNRRSGHRKGPATIGLKIKSKFKRPQFV